MRRRIAATAALIACVGVLAGVAPPYGSAMGELMFGQGHRAAPPGPTFIYHGWRVDISKAPRSARADRTARAIKAQLDIVEHVGLSPATSDFMRRVPIGVDAARTGDAGLYARGRGVFVKVKALDPKRPVILRELLYAYQDQKLPGGQANPDIARFRRQAIDKHVWPKTAQMLRSDPDFFAITASAYLFGDITREPYTRADLRKTQPEYYQWLANLFDGGKARR